MDKSIKKGLVITVIFLFICVSFQPVFAVDIKPSNKTVIESLSGNDEKVEYVIQIIKTNKIIENKVYLTRQQADDLENLIDDIRADLNGSKSSEDTNRIFYDAVDSFNGLGIFPDNISINEIKQLVTGENRDLDKIRFKSEMDEGFKNSMCHVSGETTNTYFVGPALLLFGLMIVSWFGIVTLLGILDSFFGNFTLINLTLYTLFFLADIFCIGLPFLLLPFYSVSPVSKYVFP